MITSHARREKRVYSSSHSEDQQALKLNALGLFYLPPQSTAQQADAMEGEKEREGKHRQGKAQNTRRKAQGKAYRKGKEHEAGRKGNKGKR